MAKAGFDWLAVDMETMPLWLLRLEPYGRR